MIRFTDLQEGVYDPNIFKAFFLAGGPGSGKSFVVRRTTGGLGMKIVNSDAAFERLLDKEGLDKKMPLLKKHQEILLEIEQKNLLEKEKKTILKVDLDLY